MLRKFFGVIRGRKGQGIVEYGILVGGVALVCLAAVAILGHKTNDLVATVAAVLPGAHTDDQGPILSGKLVSTTANASGVILLDVSASGAGTFSDNLGFDASALVVDP